MTYTDVQIAPGQDRAESRPDTSRLSEPPEQKKKGGNLRRDIGLPRVEPIVGLEPNDLRITKPLLYRLSYTGK